MRFFILGIQSAIDKSALIETSKLFDLIGHNTGNLAFHYALDRLFGPNLPIASWYGNAPLREDIGDFAILPCANQLGAHVNLGKVADRFSRIKTPMIAVGLGVQGDSRLEKVPDIPDGTLRWVQEVADHSPSGYPNIGVRGPFTQHVLEHYGFGDKVIPLGCPTLFINPDPELGKTIQSRTASNFERIAVTAGHHRWSHLARLEASLTRMLSATGGAYIVQSPLQMLQVSRNEFLELSQEDRNICRNYACPELNEREFAGWARKHARSFFDISAWMEYLRNFDFVIGTRIHGTMLGLQAGIPSLCIAHDSRTRELCEFMKLPYVMASSVSNGISRDSLTDLFMFDADEFDENRRRIAKAFNEFYKNNNISHKNILNT